MSFAHAMLFAILQGATELFPVSSLGHAVIVPAVLLWRVNQASPGFVPFLALLHLGTAVGMLLYFWADWLALLRGLFGLGQPGDVRAQRQLLWLLIVATVPAVVVGVLVKKPVAHLFASPRIACLFLVANALLLVAGEQLRRRGGGRRGVMGTGDALIIGLFQCLAFLPGISRSGAAIVGGLSCGARHEHAAKFAFLIGTPVILAANALELPKLAHLHGLLGVSLLAALVAGVVAFASTAFLMRYFQDHDAWALRPFAWYCAAAGAGGYALLMLGL